MCSCSLQFVSWWILYSFVCCTSCVLFLLCFSFVSFLCVNYNLRFPFSLSFLVRWLVDLAVILPILVIFCWTMTNLYLTKNTINWLIDCYAWGLSYLKLVSSSNIFFTGIFNLCRATKERAEKTSSWFHHFVCFCHQFHCFLFFRIHDNDLETSLLLTWHVLLNTENNKFAKLEYFACLDEHKNYFSTIIG